MSKRLEILAFLLCLACAFNLRAQDKDSVRLLKPVVVTQSRLNDYAIARYELPIDSAVLAVASNGSLTDLLRKQGFGHLRSYGPGGVALPSFRGSGSSHTAVLWNGIDLVSPLNGQLDLTLVPAGLFEDVSIQTGGSASLVGNGSIGGTINLDNRISFNDEVRISGSAHIGSFGSQYYAAGVKASNQKIGSSTNIFINTAENNFPYTNRTLYPATVEEREHSAFYQYGLLQQLHLQTQRTGIFSLKFWYQKSENEIPSPTTILRTSEATEENEFYRAVAGWNFNHKNINLSYQGAFVQQDLIYSNPVVDQHSVNRYTSIVHNLELNADYINGSQLTTGIHYTGEKGEVDDFTPPSPLRNRIALFAAYKLRPADAWEVALSGREELVNGNTTPFAPTLSATYTVNQVLNTFAKVSRNYRLPTFNDLYWQGTGARGNADLQSEVALSAEAGAGIQTSWVSLKLVAFTNHVDDWIQWSPQEGQVWMPQNIKEVWSRGVESQFTVVKKTEMLRLNLSAQYTFTRSTNEQVYASGNPNEVGKQLLLTPLHEGSITVEGEMKKYILRIVNSYTGEQFNDSDNTPYNIVDDYLITNLWLSKSFERKNLTLTLTGEINNLFNVEYEARPGYPLPGINYKAGIQINFNKPKKV